ncbi:MAG TPA: glycoside hydrolase family 1 protein [Gemmatimonadales bacterium]|nr:glycoside hydrolase family 1 protein [Gemmatimonadales bacterium]
MTAFPPGFLWGTATSAHQVEGGNWNSDWWAWEHAPGSPCAEPSGDAIDHYHRYREDIALLAELGFGAYRFSLEWSRIEPEEGEFSAAALDHYARVAAACRDAGIEPIVTLHHFTSPRWVAEVGGWTAPVVAERFERFADRVMRRLGDEPGRVCTINEPNIVASMGYLIGLFPPGERDEGRRQQANRVLADAHRRAVGAVRSASPARVGLTLAMPDYQSVDGGDVEPERSIDEDIFLAAAAGDDFVGVQTYTRIRVGPSGVLGPERGVPTTQMGWEFWPEALEAALRRAHKATGLPVLVTENGIATNDDTDRIAFTERALQGMLRCLADGIPVEGYCHWSAFDNFEWALGYRPTFGLIAVDRATQARIPKPSAKWLGGIARRNAL